MNTENTPRTWPVVTIILGLLTVASFFYFTDYSPEYGMGYTVSTTNAVPPSPAGMPMPEAADQAVSNAGYSHGMAGSVTVTSASAQSAPSVENMPIRGEMGGTDAYYYPEPIYPGYTTTVSATDTREFQKIYYNASMQTRDVQGLTRKAETIVHGHDGRVDNISSSKQYGSVSFVIPQTSYDAFRDEIESLVDSRFLTVSINSQNLLPQKVQIEQQQTYTQKNLDDLKSQRAQAVSAHNTKVQSLQAQINTDKSQQAALTAETPADSARANVIANTLAQLASDLSSLNTRLSSENSQYSYQISSFDQQIKWATDSLAGVKQQDQDLLNNVATVDGTISFQWISWRDIIHAYAPGYSITLILGILTLVSYYFERRRKI